MSFGPAVAISLSYVWLGMVLAISFVEAPLKFQAPGVTVQILLGIGRLVFRALNALEVILAVGILIALALSRPPAPVIVTFSVVFVALVIQLLAVRAQLARRSDAVLSGQDPLGCTA